MSTCQVLDTDLEGSVLVLVLVGPDLVNIAAAPPTRVCESDTPVSAYVDRRGSQKLGVLRVLFGVRETHTGSNISNKQTK